MTLLTNIQNFFTQLDQQQFRRFIMIFFGALMLIFGLFVFRYYRSVSTLKKNISVVNKKRSEARDLLERYELVKRQQKNVDLILSKDRDFKILNFYENLLDKFQLTASQIQEPQTSSQSVLDGYTERTLYTQLVNLNMKKIVDLLNAIEEEERIYTKEIEIDRSSTKPMAINLKLTIATLDKELEETEA